MDTHELGYHNLWMMGWNGRLLVVQNFLEEFLTISESNVLDVDAIYSRKGYHTLCQVAMRTGLPISKTKISPPLPMVPASNTNLQAFRNQHEETDDVGDGYGDRTAHRNLLLEDWDTEPLLPKTLPNLVVTNWVTPFTSPSTIALFNAWQ